MESQRRAQLTLAICATVLLCCCGSLNALAPKGPTAWWPDPATGLMWTDETRAKQMNWQEASGYCTSLDVGGF
jgi:hypothetical protein